jgi:hypothetical protein
MEDNLKGRQPQGKTTSTEYNWESAKLALKHLQLNSCKAQNNMQILEKMEDNLQER